MYVCVCLCVCVCKSTISLSKVTHQIRRNQTVSQRNKTRRGWKGQSGRNLKKEGGRQYRGVSS